MNLHQRESNSGLTFLLLRCGKISPCRNSNLGNDSRLVFSQALFQRRNNPWNKLPLEISVFFQTPYFLLGSDPG